MKTLTYLLLVRRLKRKSLTQSGTALRKSSKKLSSSRYPIGLVCLDDIASGKRSTHLCDHLQLINGKFYRKKPTECKVCQSDLVAGIYVLGAKDDVLLWQCTECLTHYLRYTEKTTEKYLQKATDVWTNPMDWIDFPDMEDPV